MAPFALYRKPENSLYFCFRVVCHNDLEQHVLGFSTKKLSTSSKFIYDHPLSRFRAFVANKFRDLATLTFDFVER